MELQDMVGLHTLGGVETFEIPHHPYDLRGIRFTLDGSNYQATERIHPGKGSTLELILTARPPKETFSVLVFCLHHEIFGEDNLKSDILSVYDARTAQRILLLGTEDTELWPSCVLEYTPEAFANEVTQ